MFRSLNLFFYSIGFSLTLSVNANTLEEFSNSAQWKNYLYMKDKSSLILGDRYFLSSNGKRNQLEELKASINAFEKNKKNKEGYFYQCLFPLRFKLLKPFFRTQISNKDCKEFREWKAGIDIGEVYLVFSSAYPSNPASMFGHTYLRFDREKRVQIDTSKDLLGYAVSFQALTNSQDNPLLYTLKGLLGGYESYLEIKPNYVNIGIYNSGESRDLWEYQLNLNKIERENLRDHIWELSHSGAFSYYFFDENCSTHLMYLLEVIKPELSFKSSNEIFVVPQVSLREIIEKLGTSNSSWRPSLKKQVLYSFNELTNRQKNEFFENKTNINKLRKNKDSELLDTVNMYWKFKNYEANTNLNNEEKKLMYQGLIARSNIATQSRKEKNILINEEENPALGHKMGHIGFAGGEKNTKLRFRYGFHDFFDFDQGFDQSSYIKFMDINYITHEKEEFWDIDIIDILSLQNFNSFFLPLSWRVKFNYENKLSRDHYGLSGGAGLSKRIKYFQFYSLFSLKAISSSISNEVITFLDTGLKYKLNSKTQATIGVITSSLDSSSRGQTKLSYRKNEWIFSLAYYNHDLAEQYSIELGYYF